MNARLLIFLFALACAAFPLVGADVLGGPQDQFSSFRFFGFSSYSAFADSTRYLDNSQLDTFFTPCLRVNSELKTAHLSRGRVQDPRPFFTVQPNAGFALGEKGAYGRLGFFVNSFSALTHKRRDRYKPAFNEEDFCLYYRYPLELAEGWRLDTTPAVFWATLPNYHPEYDSSRVEFWLRQDLHNPYLTPYCHFRYTRHPVPWFYFRFGVERNFQLPADFSLRPAFFADGGNGRLGINRYGAAPEGDDYRDGINALNLKLTLAYRLSENCSLYAYVWQFDLVNSEARRAVRENHTAWWNKRDLTLFGLGLTLNF